ncbi:hypothetical protein [Comamonas granuli]|uniref:hypothetical protein n=1 Tax=Comamonas granuli TaxID=290309 RepID=UPI0012EB4906|nr:hypothetical protein [Comamonas granuli]
MADSNSLTPLDLARQAVTQAEAAYELALELQTLLDALSGAKDDSAPASPLIFPLQRMANRACLAADVAHVAALRVRDGLGEVVR